MNILVVEDEKGLREALVKSLMDEGYAAEGAKEFQLLEYLMHNLGMVLSREQITEKIWGFDSEAEYNNVDVYISFVRKKLLFVGTRVKIQAVRGVGDKLQEQ